MKYYYSKELQAYIDMEPLRISRKVMQAAEQSGIALFWDDDGYICNISFEEAKKLTEALGGFFMDPVQFWKVYREALNEGLNEVADSLLSHTFTEFLDRVYYSADEYIDHAGCLGDNQFVGDKVTKPAIKGRPGWFLAEDIDMETGLPFRVRAKGEGDSALMKYWDPDVSVSAKGICFAIRGYVTSVDNVSLDLGIPVESRHPKLMIRFCTTESPESFLQPEEYDILHEVLAGHDMDRLEALVESNIFSTLCKSEDNTEVSIREEITAALGFERIMAGRKGKIEISYDSLLAYIRGCRERVIAAAGERKRIVFVIGHRNPDSDTVISSLMEAYRLSACYGNEDIVYAPLLQAAEMPAEIRALLGDDIADAFVCENRLPLQEWIKEGLVRFVYTDQNYQKEYQKYVIAVTDHHSPAQELVEHKPNYSFLAESVGSATSLVYRKLKGHNWEPDERVARILYGAMLMDTENRVSHKMTDWDRTVMDQVKLSANIHDDTVYYRSLMQHLLNEKDWRKLYYRDYKFFQGYDFAEMKVIGFLGNPIFETTLPSMIEEAANNNISKNTYLTLVKITQYLEGGEVIERERLYTVFHPGTRLEMQKKVRELLRAIVFVNFPEAVIKEEELFLEVSGVGKQVSRKQIAPAIEILLNYMNQYIYIECLDKWVCRDFLQLNDVVKAADPTIMADEKNRVCSLSFPRAKELMKKLHLEMLDVKEYWKVYDEVSKKHDYRMLNSLTDSTFIEYLDTGAIDGEVIHHPNIERLSDGQWSIDGEPGEEKVIPARPGLINPAEIDRESGLPGIVHHPGDFESRLLWRYWSPPEKGSYVFSRSYIFLLGQVCLDAKMTLTEGFVNLGIRPVRQQNLKADIRIQTGIGSLRMYYRSEDDPEERLIADICVNHN